MKKLSRTIFTSPVAGASRLKRAIKLRYNFVLDQANFAVSCSDNEAIFYGVETGQVSDLARRAKIYMRGGRKAIFKRIPEHFALRYECDTTSEMIELCPSESCGNATRHKY